MYQRHVMPLSLYPQIPYSRALDHMIHFVFVKTMLFIGTTFSVTRWRTFIQRCRSFLCQEWSCCGTHLFIIFRKLRSQLSKYLAGVMMYAAYLSLPMRDSSLYVFIFVKARDTLISCTQAVYFSLRSNKRRERVWIYQPRQVLHSES